MAALTYRSQPGTHLAARITRLVMKLRFYLGGANYRSDKYKGTHAMLFCLEEQLRALDLDCGRLFREERPFEVVGLLYRLVRTSDRLVELMEDMEDDEENLRRMKMQVGILANLCQRGKPLIDAGALQPG